MRRELLLTVAIVLAFFGLSARFELSEHLAAFTHAYEGLQLDELPLTLLVLCLGLGWFAYRRTREAQAALADRTLAQMRVDELLAHTRDLTQRLMAVQEGERRALARDLHDEVGQHCTAIRAEACVMAYRQPNPGVAASAQRIDASAAQLYAMVQGMLGRLRPPALDSLGLEAALQELCETWETQTGIACAFLPQGNVVDVEDATAVALYRLAQEALTNVKRHAQATQVNLRLKVTAAHGLQFTVQDDGVGMACPEGPHTGFGLMGMRERVAALHGHIAFAKPVDGSGFSIAVTLPLTVSPVAQGSFA